MSAKTTVAIGLFGFALWLVGTPTWAQHHGDGHHGGASMHRSGFHLVSPHGVHVAPQHHDTYRYVVPATPHYGTFYNYNDTHYYTPPAPRVVVGQPIAVQKPVVAEFGSFVHFEKLAERLDTLANQFCLDLHYNYQHNANYKELYRESYQIMSVAKYLHGSEHRGDRQAIVREAGPMDKLFHHVKGGIKPWTRAENRQIGEYNLLAKAEEMESIIHHMLYDIGIKPAHDIDEAAPPPGAEAAPPPGAEVAPFPGGTPQNPRPIMP